MKKEIKFRAWDKENKKIFSVWRIEFLKKPEGSAQIEIRGYGYLMPHNYILMQYTGLKDKNGKEIYEKDIVKISLLGKNVLPEYKGRIFNWQANMVMGDDDTHHIANLEPKWLEVIGNIWENQKLLTPTQL